MCAECGFSYQRCSRLEAAALLRELPDAVTAALESVPASLLRERPEAGCWSIVEYVCHLRDVCVVSVLRIHRVRSEERPALEPMLNDVRAVRFRYNAAEVEPVLRELGVVAQALCEEILDLRDREWERRGIRDLGGLHEERTLGWIVRNAVHEAVHHVLDIRRLTHDLGDST